ncbi:unnamed protein product [Heligmosomoides polygyrus]|uniref:Dephospho-CoA kinase n=1 Tax=Heligmosomoides polygyrus TaxID=6339 RepID=A0A3P7YRP6_HELPZ|nr:unnamed protein product [Heligmosomoides polygyrus]
MSTDNCEACSWKFPVITETVIVGLTGGIATEKVTLSEIFRSHGLHVVDADVIAKKVVEPGSSELGDEFFDAASGAVDRVKMGNLVFNDDEKRRRLNSIPHPAIRREMLLQTLKHLLLGTHYVVLDKDEAVSRIAAQIRRKMEMATVLIDNNGTKKDLRAKVDALVPTVFSVLVICCFLFVKSPFFTTVLQT